MVAMREAAYALAGGSYSFGPWAGELFYEYLKDVRTYIGVVFLIEGYRFVLRRLKGEARWLDTRDDRPEPLKDGTVLPCSRNYRSELS